MFVADEATPKKETDLGKLFNSFNKYLSANIFS